MTIRSSTQVPFLTRRALCGLLGLPLEKVRVVAARVGGGFGGKQEMLTEDLVALAVLRTEAAGEAGAVAAGAVRDHHDAACRCGFG